MPDEQNMDLGYHFADCLLSVNYSIFTASMDDELALWLALADMVIPTAWT